MNGYNLLTNKEILAIINGDREFDKINHIKISMPYLSGPDLCSISTIFGLPRFYEHTEDRRSRWIYLSDLIKFCIKENKISNLLAYIFSKDKFADKLKSVSYHEVDEYYKIIVDTIIEKINNILHLSGYEMLIFNNQFLVKEINEKIKIETPTIKIIDRNYIKTLSEKALVAVNNNDFDSAITKGRTILEEVFCYVIEQKNEEPNDSGDITKLYAQVKRLYSMHQSSAIDRRINDLLSGLNKIIDSISQMRNNSSDSHGVGNRRITISNYHALLYVNASIITAEFILSVANQNLKKEN